MLLRACESCGRRRAGEEAEEAKKGAKAAGAISAISASVAALLADRDWIDACGSARGAKGWRGWEEGNCRLQDGVDRTFWVTPEFFRLAQATSSDTVPDALSGAEVLSWLP
jgi:hypothetical protein